MGKTEFDNFLRKEENKQKPEVDWDARKKWWLNQLDTFYNTIQDWLKEYIENNRISVEFNNIEIYEEVLGTYSARQMRIKVSNKIATLTPIGTILIGTKGRIDMTGNAGTIRFILADRNAKGPKIVLKESLLEREKRSNEVAKEYKSKDPNDLVWKITTNPPRIKYSDLNQDSFFNSLIEVCNG